MLHIDIQAWAYNMEDYISLIFMNLLGRLQDLEGGMVQEGFNHGAEDRLHELDIGFLV